MRKASSRGGRVFGFLVVILIAVIAVSLSLTSIHEPNEADGSDTFQGTITNTDFHGETLGVVEADTDCRQTGGPMILTCTAIIIDDSGSEIHFKYTHDMSVQPCLSSGERVEITALEDGSVTVARS